jgi:lipopolysaccharide export system permease protein
MPEYSRRHRFNNPLQVIKLANVHLLRSYLLRQLAAPFTFALAALTSLMLLSQIAKKFGSLVGKGLPWTVIAEVFALSVPFIVAMTLPMAVLLAVLYAFSHLAADNEITAMRASGISVYQILIPVFAWGVFMSGFNFVFVDQVLPRSNARLRNLLIDIGRKKPTFELQEQVINEVPPSQYFLRRTGSTGPPGGSARSPSTTWGPTRAAGSSTPTAA